MYRLVVALWPKYKFMSVMYTMMAGIGIVIPICACLPTTAQNFILIGGSTLFLYLYLGW